MDGMSSGARMAAQMLVASAALLTPVLTAPGAQASVAHPKLIVQGATEKPAHPVTFLRRGEEIELKNRVLGTLGCVHVEFGTLENQTEPGGEGDSEKVRAYGEVLSSLADGSGGGESIVHPLSPLCWSSVGLEAWMSAEPPVHVSNEIANSINGAPTERLVIAGAFGSGATHREAASLPWREEAEGMENTETHAKEFWLKTGIAMTEREAVEAEEAAAGIPPERRTGCYREPALTEVVREPGFAKARETEAALREAPAGCIKLTFISPASGLEVPFDGTLEPEVENGLVNGLRSSVLSDKGGFIGKETEVPSERSSERNERALISPLGPGYVRSHGGARFLGYLREELLTFK